MNEDKERTVIIEDTGPSKKSSVEVQATKVGGPSKAKGCGCLLIIAFVFVLLVGSLGGGLFYSDQVNDWLVSNGISIDYLMGDDNKVSIDDDDKDIVIDVTSGESRIINVVQDNMPSVVSIAVSEVSFSPQEGVIDQTNNIGSGFIVDPNGLIVTNQHVVSDINATYTVITEGGNEYDVKEIVRDDVNDIAVLKIEATGLRAVDLGNSDALVQGQTVIAFGTPLGEYAGSVTTGVISGLSRSVTTSDGGFFGTVKTFENVIQTDAAINPGNSGGPLLNSAGEVVGVNFATSAGADNISFALPVNRISSRLEEYRTYGKFIKPYIGVEYQMISEADARYYENIVAGAFIRNVVPGGPADQGGVVRGDIITKIDNDPVSNSFIEIIQRSEVGKEHEVEVYRNGEYVTLKVTLGELD